MYFTVEYFRMQQNKPIDGTEKIRFNSVFSTHPIIRRDILSQIQGSGAPQRYIIKKDTTIIGRSHDCDIPLKSNLVSRRHLSLTRNNSELICLDLDSHNGLLLNGIQVHSVALRDGDTLQIGDIVLIYHQGVQWTSS